MFMILWMDKFSKQLDFGTRERNFKDFFKFNFDKCENINGNLKFKF